MLGGLYHFMQKIVFLTIQFERHLQEIFILEPLQRIELLKNSSPHLYCIGQVQNMFKS